MAAGPLRTIAYIDEFNLYYRMLTARPAMKWLNPKALIEGVLHPSYAVTRINYYTARVSARAHDPDDSGQAGDLPEGVVDCPRDRRSCRQFLDPPSPGCRWPAHRKPSQTDMSGTCRRRSVVKVIKSEEKGSDVNLGAHLVRDAFTDAFDVAVVLTDDSDLVEPIKSP